MTTDSRSTSGEQRGQVLGQRPGQHREDRRAGVERRGVRPRPAVQRRALRAPARPRRRWPPGGGCSRPGGPRPTPAGRDPSTPGCRCWTRGAPGGPRRPAAEGAPERWSAATCASASGGKSGRKPSSRRARRARSSEVERHGADHPRGRRAALQLSVGGRPVGPVARRRPAVQERREMQSSARLPLRRAHRPAHQRLRRALRQRRGHRAHLLQPADRHRRRTCGKDEKARALRDRIARETYQAGHHTTLQHATFQFSLENVSRQLHLERAARPPLLQLGAGQPALRGGEAGARHRPGAPRAARRRSTAASVRVADGGLRPASARCSSPGPSRVLPALPRPPSHAREVGGHAQEALPGGGPVRPAHRDVRAPVPHRLRAHAPPLPPARRRRSTSRPRPARSSRRWCARWRRSTRSSSARWRIRSRSSPPTRRGRCARPAARSAWAARTARAHRAEFDAGLQGRISTLVDWSARGEAAIAQAVRNVLGLPRAALDDAAALERVLSPRQNPYLSEALAARHARQAHADAGPRELHLPEEAQPHRGQPGPAPPDDAREPSGAPGHVRPRRAGRRSSRRSWPRCPRRSTSSPAPAPRPGWPSSGWWTPASRPRLALYLLPNAFPIRFLESGRAPALPPQVGAPPLLHGAGGDLARLARGGAAGRGRSTRASPRTSSPPCTLRKEAGVTPFCPEGPRYCGVPVWNMDRSRSSSASSSTVGPDVSGARCSPLLLLGVLAARTRRSIRRPDFSGPVRPGRPRTRSRPTGACSSPRR